MYRLYFYLPEVNIYLRDWFYASFHLIDFKSWVLGAFAIAFQSRWFPVFPWVFSAFRVLCVFRVFLRVSEFDEFNNKKICVNLPLVSTNYNFAWELFACEWKKWWKWWKFWKLKIVLSGYCFIELLTLQWRDLLLCSEKERCVFEICGG